ncbi:MAG: hypothetical protein E7406_08615 [Ruminococcaceae bacterium]|nr:hypothetical protein [Oscillospiraceae bacterium]
MEEKQEIYRGKAIAVKDEKQTFKALLKVLLFCFVIFAVSPYLPFSWAFCLGAIILSAIYINKIMHQGTFIATYVLYDDELVVLTRYGFIEKETARYDLSKAVITEKTISQDGITKPFYPDEELKKLVLK